MCNAQIYNTRTVERKYNTAKFPQAGKVISRERFYGRFDLNVRKVLAMVADGIYFS
ncbi:MAG: hypothetical protein ABI621_02685 [Chloroflexota bacterium]